MTYTLEDADGFWDLLASTYGIQQSWVKFGTTTYKTDCTGSHGGGNLDRRSCNPINIKNIGIPISSGNITVSNPKEIITNALPTLCDLQTTILSRQMDLALSQWTGPTDDILQVVSMPVFLVVQAIAAMANLKQVGEKEKQEKKTALILEILGIVFAFIPFLDDLTPEIEVLDGVFEIVSAAGNTALAIKGIIVDPESAPMEILSALTGGVEKDEEDMAGLAATRRAIDPDDLTKIGTTFEKLDSDFQSIIKQHCKL